MADFHSLFTDAAARAARYRSQVDTLPIRPKASGEDVEQAFVLPTPEKPMDPMAAVSSLADAAEPGLMGITSSGFFGWVMGASHPAGVAADFLTSAWGQNCAMSSATPAAAYAEKAVAGWLLDILDLPREASVGFVSGATMANFVCLAAARTRLYARLGWDVDAMGLIGAPRIRVLIGDDAHASAFAACQYLGLGRANITRIATDSEGRIIPTALRTVLEADDAPAIVIAQAGQINTGCIDPFDEIVPICKTHNAWLHVDGAFGLWARACPDRAYLADGVEGADSWATDGHKWLQLPYESGFAIVRDRAAHAASMSICASYLRPDENGYDPKDFVPELSRRARGFPAWAVIRTLGRAGIAEMISRHCGLARLAANQLRRVPGLTVVNSVTLNQLIVDFAIYTPDHTEKVIAIAKAVQAENRVFAETASWRGRTVLRISVTSGCTQESDIETLTDAIAESWRASCAASEHSPTIWNSMEPDYVYA